MSAIRIARPSSGPPTAKGTHHIKERIERLVRIGVASAVALTLLGAAAAIPATALKAAGIEPDPSVNVEPGDLESEVLIPCPVGKLALIKEYGTPHARVQATVTVAAPGAPEGSFLVDVVYEDSIGRQKQYSAPFGRPTVATVALPGDQRGLTNIVRVYARMAGQIAGVKCMIGLRHGGPIPKLDTTCFESMLGPGAPDLTLYEYATPQAAAQMSIDYEARGIGVGFQIYMTNSVDNKARVAGFTVGAEARTHLVPGDGRGIFNVTKVGLKMEGVEWFKVLQCSPRVTTAGEVSKLDSECFANSLVTVDNPHPEDPSEARLTLESRTTHNGLAGGNAMLGDGVMIGFPLQLIPTNQENGMPETTLRFPDTGQGERDVLRFGVHQNVGWPKLLKCEVSVARAMIR